MPFYEYRCTACQHTDSLLESIKAAEQKTCPQCGKRRAFKRLMSAAGFQLKGSGWYVTDFKNQDKKAPAEKKSGEGKTKGDKTDSGKTADGKSKESKDGKTKEAAKPAAKAT